MKRLPKALALLIASITVTSSWAVWFFLDEQRRVTIQALVQQEADLTAELLTRDLRSRIFAIGHLERKWRQNGVLARDDFYSEVDSYMAQYAGLLAVSYVDSDFAPRHVAPEASTLMIQRSLAEARSIQLAALEEVKRSGHATVSAPIDLLDGSGNGFMILLPLHADSQFHGAIVLVFNVELWLSQLFFQQLPTGFLPDFDAQVRLNETPIFTSPGFADNNALPVEAQSRLHETHPFQLSIKPRAQFYAMHWHRTPEGLSALVFVSLTAAGACLWLLQRANAAETRATQVARDFSFTNDALRIEAEERRQAELAARKAREAATRFLATISHEVRTPLNAIIGMFQLIESNPAVPERNRKQARAGVDASRRLHRELSNVLDVSRLDAGALQVYCQPTPLPPYIERWRQSLDAFIVQSGKSIAARYDIDPDLPEFARIDEAALTQVVNNLLDNAVKFTAGGSVTLSIKKAQRDLVISVSDTGSGIPPERQANIFDRFYQIDGGMDRSFAGTGLGLTICRDLVALMGGDISVENIKSTTTTDCISGAKFSICLFNSLDSEPVLAVS